MILAGGAVLVALAALILWKLLQPKPPVILPPDVLAREAMIRLLGRPEDGKLLSEMSLILRLYVGAVFGFPGGGMTTAEFSAALAGNSKCDAQLAVAISNLLQACDRDKFVPQKAAPPLNAVERALRLIDLIEISQAQLKATNRSNS